MEAALQEGPDATISLDVMDQLYSAVIRPAADWIASELSYDWIVATISAGNIDLNTVCGDRGSPMHWAAMSSNTTALKLFLAHGGYADTRDRFHCTPLMRAASAGRLSCIETLLLHGANVRACDMQGLNVLHYAMMSESPTAELLDQLITYGADMNAQDKEGRTPLMLAIMQGNEKGALTLLSHEPDVNILDSQQQHALHYAVTAAMPGVVKELLARSSEHVSQPNVVAVTPLHLCAMNEAQGDRSRSKGITGSRNRAAKRSDADRLSLTCAQLLLDHGADVNATLEEGTSALHLAARNGHVSVALALVGHGANFNATCHSTGWTPVTEAVAATNSRVLDMLLEAGADPGVPTADNSSILHIAAQAQAILCAGQLLRRSAQLFDMNRKDDAGNTPLLYAVRTGRLDMIKMLIKHNADVNISCGPEQLTPLHTAAACNWPACLDLLVGKRADINAIDKFGDTALHHAACAGSVECVSRLLKHGVNVDARNHTSNTPMMVAARFGVAATISALAKAGADVNVRGERQWTPLHEAVANTNMEAVKVLLGHGANADAVTEDGATPLSLAIENDEISDAEIETLIAAASDPLRSNVTKWSPLHIAASQDRPQVIRALVEADESAINKADQDGWTPLHEACYRNNLECTLLLLACGADPNSETTRKWTPLHAAASEGSHDCIRVLLANNAEVNVIDDDGWAPLHELALRGHTDSAAFLLANGAELPEPQNTDDETACEVHRLLKAGCDALKDTKNRHGASEFREFGRCARRLKKKKFTFKSLVKTIIGAQRFQKASNPLATLTDPTRLSITTPPPTESKVMAKLDRTRLELSELKRESTSREALVGALKEELLEARLQKEQLKKKLDAVRRQAEVKEAELVRQIEAAQAASASASVAAAAAGTPTPAADPLADDGAGNDGDAANAEVVTEAEAEDDQGHADADDSARVGNDAPASVVLAKVPILTTATSAAAPSVHQRGTDDYDKACASESDAVAPTLADVEFQRMSTGEVLASEFRMREADTERRVVQEDRRVDTNSDAAAEPVQRAGSRASFGGISATAIDATAATTTPGSAGEASKDTDVPCVTVLQFQRADTAEDREMAALAPGSKVRRAEAQRPPPASWIRSKLFGATRTDQDFGNRRGISRNSSAAAPAARVTTTEEELAGSSSMVIVRVPSLAHGISLVVSPTPGRVGDGATSYSRAGSASSLQSWRRTSSGASSIGYASDESRRRSSVRLPKQLAAIAIALGPEEGAASCSGSGSDRFPGMRELCRTLTGLVDHVRELSGCVSDPALQDSITELYGLQHRLVEGLAAISDISTASLTSPLTKLHITNFLAVRRRVAMLLPLFGGNMTTAVDGRRPSRLGAPPAASSLRVPMMPRSISGLSIISSTSATAAETNLLTQLATDLRRLQKAIQAKTAVMKQLQPILDRRLAQDQQLVHELAQQMQQQAEMETLAQSITLGCVTVDEEHVSVAKDIQGMSGAAFDWLLSTQVMLASTDAQGSDEAQSEIARLVAEAMRLELEVGEIARDVVLRGSSSVSLAHPGDGTNGGTIGKRGALQSRLDAALMGIWSATTRAEELIERMDVHYEQLRVRQDMNSVQAEQRRLAARLLSYPAAEMDPEWQQEYKWVADSLKHLTARKEMLDTVQAGGQAWDRRSPLLKDIPNMHAGSRGKRPSPPARKQGLHHRRNSASSHGNGYRDRDSMMSWAERRASCVVPLPADALRMT